MSHDDFDTSGLKVQMGAPVGGSWSGEGDTANFTIPVRLVVDPVTVTHPVHDPPVAWEVKNHPLARLGFPVIACPGYHPTQAVVAASAQYMDPQPVVLPERPGGKRCKHGAAFDCQECRLDLLDTVVPP